MDTAQATTHVSLCAGYGGIDLGLKRAIPNLRTVAFSEIEAFACANLVAKMEAGELDAAPIWSDLKTFPWGKFRDRVDILSGGYPCQPFSAAGKRLGKEDPRHLWPWIADGIRLMRPRICFFENVEGHISLGLREVVEELAGIGYATTWGIFSAAEVGAPHQRKRLFILAHRIGAGLEGLVRHGDASNQSRRFTAESNRPTGARSVCIWPSRPGQPQHEWEPPRVVGNTKCGGREGGNGPESFTEVARTRCERDDRRLQSNGKTESTLGRDAHGTAGGLEYAKLCVTCDNRTDELRLLGNGVVPATAERAFRTLIKDLE